MYIHILHSTTSKFAVHEDKLTQKTIHNLAVGAEGTMLFNT